jgi:hypothetical protein
VLFIMRRRVFKTAWFSRAASKAGIVDHELCKAIEQVMKGQADDLGGGVYKKRLSKNAWRSIILAKGGNYWVYTYIFAKKDKENITGAELLKLRRLAEIYSAKSDADITKELQLAELLEICT